MKSSTKSRRRRKQRRDNLEHFGKFVIIALLLLALYIYDLNTRFGGTIHYGEGTPSPGTSAVVHFIDVGQADAACIVLPDGKTVLIDAGSNASEDQLLSYLARYGIRRIDYAVFTHPHEDHIGGADAVLAACEVLNCILPDASTATSTYDIMLDQIAKEGAAVHTARPGDTYTLGDASFTILGPAGSFVDNLNDASILLRFCYGETSFLFTGDAETAAETAAILQNTVGLNADVLKVGHHGSSTSSSELFLAAVTPDVAIISCGAQNEYGHPHAETLQRLAIHTEHIFRTDQLSSIRVYSDGNALLVQSDRTLPNDS
ncbi:MAG: MBL fold metallo-hydrolase [Ruminococcaceae bacterium]|nr:MBL fold metallo-hydrolase [Oscillospiraceae bacterium]